MSKIKILVVEDDASIAVVITAGLAAEDMDVRICDSVSARDAALAEDDGAGRQ